MMKRQTRHLRQPSEIRQGADGLALTLGKLVYAKYVDQGMFVASVVDFPPNKDLVKVKFHEDGIILSVKLRDVQTKQHLLNFVLDEPEKLPGKASVDEHTTTSSSGEIIEPTIFSCEESLETCDPQLVVGEKINVEIVNTSYEEAQVSAGPLLTYGYDSLSCVKAESKAPCTQICTSPDLFDEDILVTDGEESDGSQVIDEQDDDCFLSQAELGALQVRAQATTSQLIGESLKVAMDFRPFPSLDDIIYEEGIPTVPPCDERLIWNPLPTRRKRKHESAPENDEPRCSSPLVLETLTSASKLNTVADAADVPDMADESDVAQLWSSPNHDVNKCNTNEGECYQDQLNQEPNTTAIPDDPVDSSHTWNDDCFFEGEDSYQQDERLKGVTVICNTNSDSKRQYDKKYACPYCDHMVAKLPRHLTSQHKSESDVIAFQNTKDKDYKKQLLGKLRNLGSHIHNTKVLESRKGELLVVYRPTLAQARQPSSYSPCPSCLGWYTKSELFSHRAICILNSDKTRKHMVASRALLPVPEGITSSMQHIVKTLKADDVALVAKNDPTILKVGERLLLKHGYDLQTNSAYVRTALRDLAKLLIQFRKQGHPHATMTELIDPRNFDDIVKAVRTISGFSADTQTFKNPSTSLRLGQALLRAAGVVQSDGRKSNIDTQRQQATEYIAEHQSSWQYEIASTALRNLKESKRNGTKLLPLMKDIKLLSECLKKDIKKHMDDCKSSPNPHSYASLQKALLCLIILFNRRRAGEASKLKVEDYIRANRSQLEVSELGLAPVEVALCQSFRRVEIRGKRGRTVPVLLNSMMTEALNVLLAQRELMKVTPDNKFVFCMLNYGSLNHIRGTDVLRTYSAQCGATKPEALRSTKLRKHIATMTQLVNLNENELDVLATFMGHDIKVHREYYRLPHEAMEVAKVTKLLLGLESGEVPQDLNSVNIENDWLPIDPAHDENSSDDDDDDGASDTRKSSTPKTTNKVDPADVDNIADEDDGASDTRKSSTPKTTHKVDPADVDNSADEDDGASQTRKSKTPKTAHKVVRRPWSEAEKALLRSHFSKHISLAIVPKKHEINTVLLRDPLLHGRTWRNIKDCVRNMSVTAARKQ